VTATTTDRRSRFVGKPTSGEGAFEIPSEDVHEARIVAFVDLGTHDESYKGEASKPKLQVYVAFELDERMSASSFNHIVGQRYTMSFHEKSGLRQLAEKILNDGAKFTGDIDYQELLGKPCTVQIRHSKSADGTKTYANVADIGAVAKKNRDRVFRPGRTPFAWFIGDDIKDLPDWLPRIFGSTAADLISASHELAGTKPVGNEPAGFDAKAAKAAADIPF
jgi:hypothetical protein